MADEQNAPAAEATPGAGKKKKLILLATVVAVLLLLGGGGTWFLLSGSETEPVAPVAAAEMVDLPAPAIYLPLDPAFLTNYNVGGRPRYLQVSMSVMARDQAMIDALQLHMPMVRNRVVMLLSAADFAQLQSDEGRLQLQSDVLGAIQDVLQKETGHAGAEQVFFTNLVMQ